MVRRVEVTVSRALMEEYLSKNTQQPSHDLDNLEHEDLVHV